MRELNHKSGSCSFELRMSILRHIAQLSPSRVPSSYLADKYSIHIRTVQRILSSLTKQGYLIADDNNPRGYQVNKNEFKVFAE